MEAGGGGAEEEEQVMSEVHLGCPPHFSGLHVSGFSFSSRPLGKVPLPLYQQLAFLVRISSYTSAATAMHLGACEPR